VQQEVELEVVVDMLLHLTASRTTLTRGRKKRRERVRLMPVDMTRPDLSRRLGDVLCEISGRSASGSDNYV
jgi:hypothetical protein